MFKCPLCDNAYKETEDLYLHMEKVHSDIIPEDFTPARYLYQLKTGKQHGSCVMCKKPTGWNERTNKYHRFCENPKCKEKYREIFKERMIGKHGKITLLDDPEQQKKMLANRRISGTYKLGKREIGYTGTYELDFLKMLDNLLDWDENDIMSPSPHTYWYEYEGVRRFYIPDFYIPSLNLEVEIKDGGDNPNMHHKIQAVDKEKERLKDNVMTSQDRVSYIKIVNKQYGAFFTFLNKAKKNFTDGFKEKPIFILESVEAPVLNESSEVKQNPSNILKPTQDGFKDKYGIWNSVITINGKKYRERCESLIFKGDEVFLYIKPNGRYAIPGGSTEPHKTVEEQLIAECQEEARIEIRNPQYVTSLVKDFDKMPKWMSELPVNYKGYYTHVFVSEYNGKFYGFVDEHDADDKMASRGRFYKIEEIYDSLKPEHKEAVKLYMAQNKLTNEQVSESAKNNYSESKKKVRSKQDTLVPVYVLLTYTDSLMAKAIKTVTKQPYSHAGISLDSTLSQIFTYGRKTADDICRFTDENIFSGLLGDNRDKIKYALYVTFFESNQLKVLQQHIENIKNDIKKHRYSYKGLVNFMFGKETHDDGMFCSQFVASVIKAGDPNRLKRDISLYSPTDLKEVKGMHFVTRGILGNYNKQKVDEIVENIKMKLVGKDSNKVIESAMPRVNEELLDRQYSIVDFANMVNECTDVDVLLDSKYYIDNDFCSPILENRINYLLSDVKSSINKNENMFVILETANKRCVNGKAIVFNANDRDTTLYTVVKESQGNITNFKVDKYVYMMNKLVLEASDVSLPEENEDVLNIGFRIDTDRNTIENILENFSNIKVSPAVHAGIVLDTTNDSALENYMQTALESVGVNSFDIERYK